MTTNEMTNIGILGSGRVGSALAHGLLAAGHRVTIGTRNAHEASAKWNGAAVAFTDSVEAIRASSIVINATPGESALARLSALRNELAGRILIDVSNATSRTSDAAPAGLLYPGSSLAEELQSSLPATRVVKTLNTMLFTVMADPSSLTVPPTAFLSGDDADAKALVRGVLLDMGWRSEWIEDLGDIRTARGPESFIMLVPAIMRNHGFAPFALTIAR
jgi:8-hydroxy-5-deazaflavin:NADPH oxidoreductase